MTTPEDAAIGAAEKAVANPFEHNLRLKRPCSSCPFLKQGGLVLAPGRLDGITSGLLEDDHRPFPCHKTVHAPHGGEFDGEGHYMPSGREAMCAGAAAYRMKHRRPSVSMRVAFATGVAAPTDWEEAGTLTIA